MNLRNSTAIRPCPVCSIAMQAFKTRPDLPHFDRYECQNCDTVIAETPARPPNRTNKSS